MSRVEKRTRHITPELLRRLGACQNQVTLFIKTFGEQGAPITLKNCIKASEVGLSTTWGSMYLVSDSQEAVYDRIVSNAWNAHQKFVNHRRNRGKPEIHQEAHRKLTTAEGMAFYAAYLSPRNG